MSEMRLGAMLSIAVPYPEIARQARLAEELGFSDLASTQGPARDALTTFAALAAITERVTLSTTVVPIYAHSPASMAQAAATIDDISGGRFRLGLGVGHRISMEGWHGQSIGQPVAEMREYLGIVRSVLQGREPEPGDRWQSRFAFVDFEPRPALPIIQAALGERMLELAAEVADGVVLWACPATYVRDTIVPTLTATRARAGKSMDNFAIIACVPTAYRGDRDAVLDGVRTELHRYFGLPFYRRMFAAAGYAADLATYDAAPGLEGQKTAISTKLLNDLCALGNDEAIGAALTRYQDAGATEVLLSPVPGTTFDDALRAASVLVG